MPDPFALANHGAIIPAVLKFAVSKPKIVRVKILFGCLVKSADSSAGIVQSAMSAAAATNRFAFRIVPGRVSKPGTAFTRPPTLLRTARGSDA